jgi:hypothetical protein
MALDFPNSPTNGQQFVGPNGIIWVWDTTKWTNGTLNVAYAPAVSPIFSGDPRAPTPTVGDNDTSIATTAFVQAALPVASATNPVMNGVAAPGAATAWSRGDHVHPTDTSRYAAANPSGYQTAAQVSATVGNYFPLSGGTVSGSVTATGNILSNNNLYCTGTLVIGPSVGTSGVVYLASAGNITHAAFSGGNLNSINLYANSTWLNGSLTTRGLQPTYDNGFVNGYNGMAWSNVFSYYFGTSSDISHKTDVQPLPDCIAILQALEPKRFRFNNGADTDMFRNDTHWGFVAQDVQRAMVGHEFGGHRVEEDGKQSIAYNELVAVLWKACQELTARVAALEGTKP